MLNDTGEAIMRFNLPLSDAEMKAIAAAHGGKIPPRRDGDGYGMTLVVHDLQKLYTEALAALTNTAPVAHLVGGRAVPVVDRVKRGNWVLDQRGVISRLTTAPPKPATTPTS